MLMRTDPFRELDRLTQETLGTRMRPAAMPIDAYRRGDQFVVHFDLPGVDPASIDLTIEKNVLNVSAERQWQHADELQIVAAERPHGTFTRQLFLGEGLDVDRVDASYENGVLTVTIPVAEQAKPRRVQISAGDGAAKAIQTATS
ncbi:MAG TPA: Hsp20/alpha crystallin family protein [Acidimicrobiia bacterium]|nr:Hsp20/alpha crystallin family protein [Acidimicrobiia bacterium]